MATFSGTLQYYTWKQKQTAYIVSSIHDVRQRSIYPGHLCFMTRRANKTARLSKWLMKITRRNIASDTR